TSPGTTYYRVRSTNNEGTSALSKVVALQPTTASGLQAWPNPATQSWVQISHPAATSTRASLRVVGMQGAVLMQVPVAKGSVTTLVNLGSQAAGMYRIVFTDGASRQQLPLVVK
ncbi:MAG TPA: T9SS type A sorting domain-containing protein, partial [Phnomibacter sp.]|nr:T9SS type A sorting domain-containing protein [Phnomibacter sp.]